MRKLILYSVIINFGAALTDNLSPSHFGTLGNKSSYVDLLQALAKLVQQSLKKIAQRIYIQIEDDENLLR